MGAHPGSNGDYSILRWTAPNQGSYFLSTIFSGLENLTTSDVHVLYNGTSLFDENIDGFGLTAARNFSTNLSLATGDTLDFAVGFGSNRNYFNDTAGIQAVIATPVPWEIDSLPVIGSTVVFGLALWGKQKLSQKKDQ